MTLCYGSVIPRIGMGMMLRDVLAAGDPVAASLEY